MRASVAIVGGGLAGLHAARQLQAAHVDFVLLEARDRLGGRILSADQAGQSAEDGFDLGPSWFWPDMQPALAALMLELGLAVFPQNSTGDVLFERMSRENVHRLQGLHQQAQSMRLVGGASVLIRTLACELACDRIVRDARVRAMTLASEGIEIAIESNDGRGDRVVVDQVIAAMPPRLLEATVSFAPALEENDARRWRDTPTWMAPHAKFFALYDRAFWREAGLSGTAQSMVGPMVEIHDATTLSGHAALFGFLGVAAEQRAARGEPTIARACVEQLARLFGKYALSPRATLFKDWAADPLTATAADRAAGGHLTPKEGAWVSGAWKGRLMLGGSETSSIDPGYLSGAVEAAKRAVAETLRVRGADVCR